MPTVYIIYLYFLQQCCKADIAVPALQTWKMSLSDKETLSQVTQLLDSDRSLTSTLSQTQH